MPVKPRRLFRRRPAVPGYLPAVLAETAARPPAPGEVTELVVLHDPDCPAPRGRRCRCRPEVMRRGEYERRQAQRN